MAYSKKFVSNDDINFRWKPLSVLPTKDKEARELLVSNDEVPLPNGLSVFNDFLSEEDAAELHKELQSHEFSWEGFEQRRRVQRYSLKKEAVIPAALKALMDAVASQTGYQPLHVSVEEYSSGHTLKITQYGSNGYNGLLTGFECLEQPENSSGCFVAQIPLRGSAVKHLNKPKRRHPSCFDLESNQHWTDVRVDPNGLLLQTGDCLWNWRSRVSAIPPAACVDSKYKDTTFLIVKLYSLPTLSASTGAGNPNSSSEGIDFDTFGYMGAPETSYCSDPMPPLEEVLTIIVTTSPIQSNPSTKVLETTFETFLQAGSDFACKCRKVIICDGYRRAENKQVKVTKRYTNPKQSMRNGIVTDIQAENYIEFKRALREVCANASSSSPFHNTVVEELEERQGYGFALKHALHNCVTTPYVCVIQHDRTFMRPTPMVDTMRAMWHHRNVKYVTISMRSNLMYKDLFMGKYGKTYYQEYDNMIVRPPELNLDKNLFGPVSESANKMTYNTPEVKKSVENHLQKYLVSNQALGQKEWLEEHPNEPGKNQLTLTPTLYWYDNVHIVETAHYRDFVFDPRYKMVKKGGFVEDKLSPVLLRTLEKLGLSEGHKRFGCFLLDDHSGLYFTGHLDGGNYLTQSKKKEMQEQDRAKKGKEERELSK